MFVIGICIGPSDRFDTIAGPSIDRWAEPDSLVIGMRDQQSIFAAYNAILDSASGLEDLEGVVLMHDDVEILGDVFDPLRSILRDSSIGLVGTVGGAGNGRAMAWFSRDEWLGDFDGRGYHEQESHRWGDVDVVDGYIMILSSDAAREIRFDLSDCVGFHRYDAELSSLVRATHRRVVVQPLPVRHVNSGMYGSRASYVAWARANLRWRIKWGNLSWLARLILRMRVPLMPLELRLRPSGRRRLRQLP